MKISVCSPQKLTPEMIAAWKRFQESDPELSSPYLRPEFTLAVAAVRDDVEVAVLEDEDGLAGFFPFQRSQWNIAQPVGGQMCDFQALIGRRGLKCDAEEIVRACGLNAWDFHGLLATQDAFRKHHYQTHQHVYMNLAAGFEAYSAERRSSGSQKLKQTEKYRRRLERAVGPVRCIPHTADPAVFETLVRWKRAQYQRTRVPDVFEFGWTRALLEKLLYEPSPRLALMQSALYAGDQLVAVELGLRSGELLHEWFPAYDPAFARYSPGHILVVELAKQAPELGITRVDAGKITTMEYKGSFMSGSLSLAEGSVAVHPLVRMVRWGWPRLRDSIKTSPLRAPAELAGSWTRNMRGRLSFR